MKNLRMKCSSCGHWNRVSVSKILIEQTSPEPKVKAYVPMYEPLEVSKCEKYFYTFLTLGFLIAK